MITIDNLLLKIVNFTVPSIEEKISIKDSRVLRNLSTSINSHLFITENQSRLLIKILKDNKDKLSEFSDEISESLKNPNWSRSFRKIEQLRKFYIGKNQDHELLLHIDFTFSSEIRKIISDLNKSVDSLVSLDSGKTWTASLTEKNIVLLVDALTPLNFEIDESIKNYYETIKSWSEIEIKNQFLITNITNLNFQKHITSDLGIETSVSQNIINDRSVRYQYFVENPKNSETTLTDCIANRTKTRVWINNTDHNLTSIISSLIDLKRLPILVIFDTLVSNKYLENLEKLHTALENNGITSNIGIYFRLENDENGKKFNTLISNNHYNYPLNNDTLVAGVMSGKLPKFFLKNNWKPMSVITLDSRMGMRHGKTAVYSNCCDCIIEWSDAPSIAEKNI